MKIKGQTFKKIKDREFTCGEVYKSSDGLKYLRISKTKNIMKDEGLYVESLYNLGFPVPSVIERGQIGNREYYIEQSIGEITLGDKFNKEYILQGKINQNTFKYFCNILCNYFNAQLNSPVYSTKQFNFEKIIMLSNVLKENPDLDPLKVKKCIKKINKRLLTLPNVFSHGDLTPRNTFDSGIIDFEFHFIAPAGFDVLTAPLIESFWNFKDAKEKKYRMFYLNQKQINYYFNKINIIAEQHHLSGFLSFVDDFLLLKAFYMLAYEKKFAKVSGDTSKWKFRKKILIHFMESYLDDKKIDIGKFIKFETSFKMV